MPREAIRNNLPEVFIKTVNNKFRVILDCAEVFTERPKSLDCQAATWSDYRQHNTIKFLVGISPSGFITFLQVPAGARTKTQMTKNKGTKGKRNCKFTNSC